MSQKKRLLFVGAAILVLIAALLAFFLWPKEPSLTPGVDKTVSLHAFSEADVTGVSVIRPDALLSFSKQENGSWKLAGRDTEDTDASMIFETVRNAAVLTAIEKLADAVDNPSDYGFDVPSVTVSVQNMEGELSGLIFGNKTLDQSAYYVMRKGESPVYLVASQVAESFFYQPTQYLKKGVFTVNVAEVSSVVLNHPEYGTVQIVRTADPEEEGLLGQWAMRTPYEKATRAQETENWITSILSLSGADVVEDLTQSAQYGLDQPNVTVTVTTQDGKKEDIAISTERLALKKGGKDRIYLMDDTAFSFLDTAPFNLLDPFICSVDIGTLSAFSWTDANGTHTAKPGNAAYVIDGKTVEEKTFKNAYLDLMMITLLSPKQEGDDAVTGKTPVFSYVFTGKDGSKNSVVMYEINSQTYLAEVNGRADYRVDAQKVQTAQQQLNSLL